jgi:hypothetical protein
MPIGAATTKRTVCNLAELGNNGYQYGTRDQGDRFTRTTEAIANYVGREYSKEMRLLKNQEENEPEEPVLPEKEEAKSRDRSRWFSSSRTGHGGTFFHV